MSTKVTNRVIENGTITTENLSRGSTFTITTTNYTLQLQDANSTIGLSGQTLTSSLLSVLVPNNNFPTGYQINFVRIGLGPVVIAAALGSNVVFRTSTNGYQLSYPYSIASLFYTGDPNLGWLLYGDLA